MALSLDDHPELLTRLGAAQFLGVSVNTVDRMIARGQLEAFRLTPPGPGRATVRISRAACIDALNRSSNLAPKKRPGRPRKA